MFVKFPGVAPATMWLATSLDGRLFVCWWVDSVTIRVEPVNDSDGVRPQQGRAVVAIG